MLTGITGMVVRERGASLPYILNTLNTEVKWSPEIWVSLVFDSKKMNLNTDSGQMSVYKRVITALIYC